MYLRIISRFSQITAAAKCSHRNLPSGDDDLLGVIWEVTLKLSFAALLTWLKARASNLLSTASGTAISCKHDQQRRLCDTI